MENKRRYIRKYIFLLMTLSIACFSSLADTISQDPIYCTEHGCLYCDDNGNCFTRENQQPVRQDTKSDDVSASSINAEVNQFLDKFATENSENKTPTAVEKISIKAKKTSRKSPKQRSKIPRKPTKVKSSIQRINPKVIRKKYNHIHYLPALSVAQYALHQGDARWGNLIEAFVPFHQKINTFWFFNLRYYNPNGIPMEWNGDVGFRGLFDQCNRLLGLYGGYDRYRSGTGRYFNQIHAGVEYWVKRFFMGGNAYAPVGTKVYPYDAVNQAFLVSTNISYRYNIAFGPGQERALPGIDAEIGYDITNKLTIYAGAYYFDNSDVKSIAGPKVRTTYTLYRSAHHHLLGLFDRIRFEGLISHDSVRGTSWYAGIRFSISSLTRSNPTQGLARHMVDPLRRDLNVIDAPANESNRLYTINGQPAIVDIVSSQSGLTMDTAVNTNTDSDIIGVRGDQINTPLLTIGNRSKLLNITGAQYNFIVEGRPYTIMLGNSGKLMFNGHNLFNVSGTSDVVLQYMNFDNTDNHYLAINNGLGSFGHLTINHNYSNSPIDLTITNTTSTGNLAFTNNILEIYNSQALNSNNHLAGISLITKAADIIYTIDRFSNNTITVINNQLYPSIIGIYLESSVDPIEFIESFHRNIVNVQSPGTTNTMIYGMNNAGTVLFDASITSNQMIASMNDGGDGYGWCQNGPVVISESLVNNTFIASNNYNNGYGLYNNDPFTVLGNVQNNQFIVLANANDGHGWFQTINVDTVVNVSGNVEYNRFTVSANQGSGFGWDQLDGSISVANIQHNIFELSNNTKSNHGIRWQRTVAVTGVTSSNHITLTGNMTNNGLYLNIPDSITITFEQPVRSNIITINNDTNGATGFNLITAGTGTISFNGNQDGTLTSLNYNASVSASGNIIYKN